MVSLRSRRRSGRDVMRYCDTLRRANGAYEWLLRLGDGRRQFMDLACTRVAGTDLLKLSFNSAVCCR